MPIEESEVRGFRRKISTINLIEGLSLVSPYPAAYIEEFESLVVSDTHLGIESKLASRGVHFPMSVFKETLDSVLVPSRELECKKLYVLGDLKHRYGRPDEADWWAIRRFVKELRSIGCELVLVRGNHDRYLTPVLRALGVTWREGHVNLGGFILTHGHKRIKTSADAKIKAIVIGHEHPAIALSREFGGRKERFKTFLYVPSRRGSGAPILVLPSVNPVAYGTDVNELDSSEFLSPYLKENKNLKHARPYVLEVGEVLLQFPELSKL
jgi:uncharacterized protein